MTALRLLVGLGNPGTEHAHQRHNAGFWFADALAASQGVRFLADGKLFGEVAKVDVGGRSLWVLKPSTFMNRSGQSVSSAMRFWKIAPEEMLVVHDELDLAPGVARLKFDGGHGGQNGLRDLFAHLGGGHFHRLRIGIGHPGQRDKVTGWVLGKPGRDDEAAILRSIDDALAVLPQVAAGQLSDAMKQLHTSRE